MNLKEFLQEKVSQEYWRKSIERRLNEMKYILDAWAVLAWLGKEKGYLKVRGLLDRAKDGEIELGINMINFGEVYYVIGKEMGLRKAESIEEKLRLLPIKIRAPLEENQVMSAASIKAQYPISYADAFAASIAEQEGAMLVTGDDDFKALGNRIEIFWLK